jgi:hypothetical protein
MFSIDGRIIRDDASLVKRHIVFYVNGFMNFPHF